MKEAGEPLEDYYHQVIEGNHISSLLSLIILVGTQNASHRKKLKTDFTTSTVWLSVAPERSTKGRVMAEILSPDIQTSSLHTGCHHAAHLP